MENEVKLSHVNFILDNEKLDFIGYEFEIEGDILIEESECEQSLFRLDMDKETGDIEIYCAYSQYYDVMEEASHYFDEQDIFISITNYIKEHEDEVPNKGEIYVRYLELIDQGWEADDATFKAETEFMDKE